MKTDDKRCRECGVRLIGKNAIDVGYCLSCYNMMMCEGEEDDFEPCSECDGCDACADFGCAIKAGLSNYLRRPFI